MDQLPRPALYHLVEQRQETAQEVYLQLEEQPAALLLVFVTSTLMPAI